MAEKEERIYIRGYGKNNPCDTCEDVSGDNCDFCMENYEWNASISRQEAIERIAKAAKKVYRGYFYAEPHHPNVSDMMEAALNALLEGK